VERTIWLMVAATLCGTPKAYSQTAQPLSAHGPFFVSVGILAETDRTWPEAQRATEALSLVAGADRSPHFGVRLAVDVPRVYTTRSEDSYGLSRTIVTEHPRSISWSGLLDCHGQLTDRVRLGVLAGFSYTLKPSEQSVSRERLGPGDVVLEHVDKVIVTNHPDLGVTLGTELPVSITGHLTVVPEASVTRFPLAEYGRTSIVRAGASLRWRF